MLSQSKIRFLQAINTFGRNIFWPHWFRCNLLWIVKTNSRKTINFRANKLHFRIMLNLMDFNWLSTISYICRNQNGMGFYKIQLRWRRQKKVLQWQLCKWTLFNQKSRWKCYFLYPRCIWKLKSQCVGNKGSVVEF